MCKLFQAFIQLKNPFKAAGDCSILCYLSPRFVVIYGSSSESDNFPILLSINILLYFVALITNMIMIITDKVIFKVKTSKNSKILIFLILF